MSNFNILKEVSLEDKLYLLKKLSMYLDNMTEFTEKEMEYMYFLVEEDIDDATHIK